MAVRAEITTGGLRVLDAGATLFYRDGINTVGVAAVADAAGVTKKTLYDCFGSKARLVATYLQDRHETWWAYLEERLAGAETPKTLALFDAYLEHPALDVSNGCAFLNAAAELPVEHPGVAVVRAHKDAVRDRIRTLLSDDAPTADADELAEHIFLLLEGAITHLGVEHSKRHTDCARRIVADLIAAHRKMRLPSNAEGSIKQR